MELSKFITKDDLIKIQKINSSIFSSLNQIAKTEKNQDLYSLHIQEKTLTFKFLREEIDEVVK